MKKAYITPSVEVIKVNATSILAASNGSMDTDPNTGVDSGTEMLGRDETPSNPNIWDQNW